MTKLEEDIFDIEEAMYSGFYDYQLYQNTNENLRNVLSVTDIYFQFQKKVGQFLIEVFLENRKFAIHIKKFKRV